MWFLIFIKQLPGIAIAEIKEIVPPRMRFAHPPDPESGVVNPAITGGTH
jgi:hypothetical protein